MFPQERRKIILDMLKKSKIIKIGDLVEKFEVSVETVRRDLEELESKNKLERIYGGAIAVTSNSIEPSYAVRVESNHEYKVAIGKSAAALINNGDAIILDLGTTCLEIAKNIQHKNITVLTSSLPIMNELANSNVKIYCLGGLLRPNELSMSGIIPEYALKQFFVDKAFIAPGGVSFSEGISDYNIEEAQIRKLFIERAKESILVADNSKFGINAFALVAPLESISTIITDWDVDEDILENIKELNIDVIIAQKNSDLN
ncbi:DeoR/GlpR family DNA-binding transcription regulator [Clostridium sp.]|uniref:DeoR/GlpR family DNA-binding transcription regulator n=1 Tax=Clostridium sp. TaxID=1506 RepID=UPI001A40BCD0|nr:DeoR/GlpR family DNA-binding transcription regulator [Clostridium sp.]MBK5243136.1 DeoR/GlpR transcriptional regulator [Clostridium sp.]